MKRKGMWLCGAAGERGSCALFQLFSQHLGWPSHAVNACEERRNEGSETCPLRHNGSWH